MDPGAAVGICVRSVRTCPGTTFCRIGDQIAEGLSDKEAISLVDRIINFYKENGEKKRLGRLTGAMVFGEFKSTVL